MSTIRTYNANHNIFQEFFLLLGKMNNGDLVRQVQYLKVENQILFSKDGNHFCTGRLFSLIDSLRPD